MMTARPAQRDLKRLVMEQRDPEQRQREQDEVDGYSKHKNWLDHHGLERALDGCMTSYCALFQRLQPCRRFR